MKIIIAGGSGLIGTTLSKLLTEKGHEVFILSRKAATDTGIKNLHNVQWDAKTADKWGHLVEECDAIVNLAGASIGGGLWTPGRRRVIAESRLNAGKALVEAILNANHKPKILVQVSGVDYYPSDDHHVFIPSDSPGKGFMPETAVLWEKSTEAVEGVGVRRVVMRLSQVLSSKGGSLEKIILPFKFFLGGPLGSGEQWWTWIHLYDAASAMAFVIENTHISGAINLTSPNPLQMKAFGKILAGVINRPYWFPAPEPILKIVLGEMSLLLLGGRKVYPQALEKAGFVFRYPELEMALNSLIK